MSEFREQIERSDRELKLEELVPGSVYRFQSFQGQTFSQTQLVYLGKIYNWSNKAYQLIKVLDGTILYSTKSVETRLFVPLNCIKELKYTSEILTQEFSNWNQKDFPDYAKSLENECYRVFLRPQNIVSYMKEDDDRVKITEYSEGVEDDFTVELMDELLENTRRDLNTVLQTNPCLLSSKTMFLTIPSYILFGTATEYVPFDFTYEQKRFLGITKFTPLLENIE